MQRCAQPRAACQDSTSRTADLEEGDFNVYLQLLHRHRLQPDKGQAPLTVAEYAHMSHLQSRIVQAGLDVVRPARNPYPWETQKRRLQSFNFKATPRIARHHSTHSRIRLRSKLQPQQLALSKTRRTIKPPSMPPPK